MTSDHLYIGINGHVAALRVSDGGEVWRTALDDGGSVSATSHQDVCVLVEEGRVFAGCNGYVFCLDPSTGRVVWKNGLKGLFYNDVTLARPGQAVQVVSRQR